MSVGVTSASDAFLIFMVLAINLCKNTTIKMMVLITLQKGVQRGKNIPEQTESKKDYTFLVQTIKPGFHMSQNHPDILISSLMAIYYYLNQSLDEVYK